MTRSPWQRTHSCGELTIENVGTEVVLNGWIENHRDHGQLVFVDLRDRYGVTQTVAHIETNNMAEGTVDLLRRLGAEDVVSVRGNVRARDDDKINKARSTGEIELLVTEVIVLSEADTPPFEVLDDVEANEELRMKYRYLDLRRRPLQEGLIKRSRFVTAMRTFLAGQDFIDVETPILTGSTPEG
ncbi:MAG: aspartyl-tRNA synthetase, partial [Neolewinella sp.]